LIALLGLVWTLSARGKLDFLYRQVDRWLLASRVRLYQLAQAESEAKPDQLTSCQAALADLQEENWQLRRLLGAGIKPKTQLIPGRVVAANDRRLILALTSDRSVASRAAVVKDRFLVGYLGRRQGLAAAVQLLTDPEFRLPVKIWLRRQLAEQGQPSLAEGLLQGGEPILVKEILASEKIQPGYWVATVVETGDLFLIGQIKKVYPSEDKVFQEAEVEWMINPKELLTVGIIKP